jgi:hypothetical protein
MCFDIEWLKHLFIYVVVVCAVVAIIQVLINLVLPRFGEFGAVIIQILRIVFWAAIAIFIIVVAFDLISCLVGWVGPPPSLRGR